MSCATAGGAERLGGTGEARQLPRGPGGDAGCCGVLRRGRSARNPNTVPTAPSVALVNMGSDKAQQMLKREPQKIPSAVKGLLKHQSFFGGEKNAF